MASPDKVQLASTSREGLAAGSTEHSNTGTSLGYLATNKHNLAIWKPMIWSVLFSKEAVTGNLHGMCRNGRLGPPRWVRDQKSFLGIKTKLISKDQKNLLGIKKLDLIDYY